MRAGTNVILVVHGRTHRHWPDTSTIHKARDGPERDLRTSRSTGHHNEMSSSVPNFIC
jgi:hypothetical protein